MKVLKYILLIFILVPYYSCSDKENFDWLLGDWIRTNEEAGRTTYESWTKISHTEYRSFGFTLSENDTVWKEVLSLEKKDNKWVLWADIYGEDGPVPFDVTEIEKGRFKCENQENSFPEVILYFKDGEKLKAIISADDMLLSFDYIFEKTEDLKK